jgi:hypothetical protein
MNPDDDKNLEILEAIYHDAALAHAEDGESTPEQKEWAERFHGRIAARIQEMKKNLALPATKRAQPIKPSYLAMARDALLAKLDELVAVGRLQVAHRNLSTLSDDDLRRLLQSLEPDSD